MKKIHRAAIAVQAVSEKYQDCAFAIPVLVELVNEVERIVNVKRKE